MSQIDDLITDMCPRGVPYVGLTEVAHYIRGVTYNKNDEQSDGPIGVLRANNITLASNTLNFDDVKRISGAVRVREDQRLRAGDILICAGSGSKAHIGKVAYIREDISETFGGFMGVVRVFDALEPRFLFHLLTGRTFVQYLQSTLSPTTINNLNAGLMRGFRIPVPPLEVQREIVRILDQFIRLEAELEAELEARRRQFTFYRTKVLEGSSEWVTGPLATLVLRVSSGRNQSRADDGAYPVYGSTGRIASTNSPQYSGDALLIARVGANAGRVTAVSGEYDVSDNTLVVTPTPDWDLRFAFHQLTAMNLNQYAVGGGQPLVTGRVLKALMISTPRISEQKRIAAMLDKLHTLVNDVNVGLPAELAARRTQYRYYRDEILMFREDVA